ncbi:MAG TPA: hypothetical protein VFC78_24710 [Tepidisphaeraceae bacterium]|nr:hypothetical protein [Tepidisphaeraceae bacterium]
MSNNPEYETVLKAVANWPPDQRVSLAHALIDSLGTRAIESSRAKPALDQLVGIARGSGAVPTDGQVSQWIDEARMQKYER